MKKTERANSFSRKIGLLISEKAEYGRGVLRGIANFSKNHPDWYFRVVSPDGEGIDVLRKWDPDGLIVMLNRKELVPKLASLCRPIITVCNLPGGSDIFLVQSDDEIVGRLAAEHLLERNAAMYGYVGLARGEWVEVRGKAFMGAIKRTGSSCLLFDPMGQEANHSYIASLGKWLIDSPKPLAILACNDECGRLVVETARNVGLLIPEDVAVLGVDNDEPLSSLVWPGLSSVVLATDHIGQHSASMLHKILNGQPPPKKQLYISPLGVAVRGSTSELALSDPILSRVLTAINEGVGQPLSVSDLVKLVPMSRISLERLFRRVLGRTPLQEIRRTRIAQARNLLLATNLPIKAIAEHCGYAAPSRLIEAFHKETSQSPSAYRSQIAKKRELPYRSKD